ncbi:histidine kinase [Frankia sp. AgB1.9]|uniref:sensor histidine kinase n=1 Tax=unclassified Frankia TaxID=2632575 RepID=UPI001933CC80|nr:MULTISPECIES: ATP-binding protein [unclassified Frankia]MBL7491186.1 histidine kinase [Frankia sp. AgW1.1]MBL7551599.1 histidine kinase [Frankia sp. AgB1.9]MBL7621936.1 histidine kinase [Frankia sp. AgB1.8]
MSTPSPATSRSLRENDRPGPPAVAADESADSLPADQLRRLVSALPSGVVVLTTHDEVVMANPAARAMGVVIDNRIGVPSVADIVRRTRRAGAGLDGQLDLPPVPPPPLTRPRPDQEPLAVRVRTRPLGGVGHIAVILDDVTESRRVDAVRRDFVANISHELKTPVGALHVLAEAVHAASDDPVAVRRFADRMTHESARLARLVQEIIHLSRLQGADPLPELRPVAVDNVTAEAVDRNRLAAQTRGISVAVIGQTDAGVLGDEAQLVTAVANLLENAVNYSPRGTRVGLGVRSAGDMVEISVADEGIGIAEKDLERVFERFYRADPARSRETGGTGLGLAIVKHIVTNHGGTVGVWSSEGAGSTFTLRLPSYHDDLADGDDAPETAPQLIIPVAAGGSAEAPEIGSAGGKGGEVGERADGGPAGADDRDDDLGAPHEAGVPDEGGLPDGAGAPDTTSARTQQPGPKTRTTRSSKGRTAGNRTAGT